MKCEQYWPDAENEEKMYGDIGVTLTSVERTVDFVVRSYELRKSDTVRYVKQFHYTTWPDHGVPIRASPIIAFRRRVRSYDDSHPGVIVVHCRSFNDNLTLTVYFVYFCGHRMLSTLYIRGKMRRYIEYKNHSPHRVSDGKTG